MRALVYNGAYDVEVTDVADPRIEKPTDALIRITSTNICGSDLHMYEGRTDMDPGRTLGHENMGIVEEVGSGVDRIQVGDRVSLPFNIACGTCDSCVMGQTGYCFRANHAGTAGAAYGFAAMGDYGGGQAEYLRVPWADFNALVLPEGGEKELDYTMLSDIFPTGWHGVELSRFYPGDSVVVWGAGPVGLMAAHSARIRGASVVYVVDQQDDRLDLARQDGATAIDMRQGDPVKQIMDATNGRGTDRGVEAIGYQAFDTEGEEKPSLPLDNLVQVVKATGGIGVVGVYLPQDPGAVSEQAGEGRIAFDYGTHWFKGQTMGTGQCNTKMYNRQLRDLITTGVANPSFIVSHELSLEEAARGYDQFDKRVDGWTKVILHPDT